MKQVSFENLSLRKSFDQRGFVTLGKMPSALIENTQKIYEQLPVQWNRTGFYSSMMISDPNYREKVLEDLGSIARQCLDNFLVDYEILFSNFLVKLPNTDNYVGMHQDWNFTDEANAESINFWMPLIDVDDTNGNLYMVESSHNYFLHPRGTPYVNYFQNYESTLEQKALALFPKKSEMILYHGRLLHFSKPNQSTTTRIAIGGVIIPKGTPPMHYRNCMKDGHLEWLKYSVDQHFFKSFTPETVIDGYPFETVTLNRDYFSEPERQKIITQFINS